MTSQELKTLCEEKEKQLLKKYFGNLAHEAAIERPETIGEYTKDLPLKIETEYHDFLEDLWLSLLPADKKDIPLVLDEKILRKLLTDDDREMIQYAHKDAVEQTLWERIAHTNHKDVTYYKGLLLEYTQDLLDVMCVDFLEEITGKIINDDIKAFEDIKICAKITCGVKERQECKDYMTPFCRFFHAERK